MKIEPRVTGRIIKRNNSIAHILSFGQILGHLDNSIEYLRYTLFGYSSGWLDHSLATLPSGWLDHSVAD